MDTTGERVMLLLTQMHTILGSFFFKVAVYVQSPSIVSNEKVPG